MDVEYQKLLDFIDTNLDKIIQEPTEYANQIQLAFSYKFYPSEINHVLFPPMRLHVERLNDDFVEKNFLALFKLAQRLHNKEDDNTFNSVWVTTSFIKTSGLLLVMISFE